MKKRADGLMNENRQTPRQPSTSKPPCGPEHPGAQVRLWLRLLILAGQVLTLEDTQLNLADPRLSGSHIELISVKRLVF